MTSDRSKKSRSPATLPSASKSCSSFGSRFGGRNSPSRERNRLIQTSPSLGRGVARKNRAGEAVCTDSPGSTARRNCKEGARSTKDDPLEIRRWSFPNYVAPQSIAAACLDWTRFHIAAPDYVLRQP